MNNAANDPRTVKGPAIGIRLFIIAEREVFRSKIGAKRS
jgi:hypothetical protein